MHIQLKHALALSGALFFGLASTIALADSTSSASSAASNLLGSSSTSLERSSRSSSSKERVAQGEYTVVEVAAVDQRPDLLRVRMLALANNGNNATDEIVLLLPRETAESVQLMAGQTVAAKHRPYGLAFATVNPVGQGSPFFLVLDDDWYRELDSRPVVL
jgi:hypothetical protein